MLLECHHSTKPQYLSHHAANDRDPAKETTDAAEFHLVSPRHRAKSTAIPRRTHLKRCRATIAVPSADRRYFSANKRIQHERRTQHGCGTSRVRGKVASCRGRGSRQQRPRQGQGTFDPSPAARAECERAFQDGAGQERPAEVTVSPGKPAIGEPAITSASRWALLDHTGSGVARAGDFCPACCDRFPSRVF